MREILFRGKTNKTLINGVPHYTNKGAWVKGSLTVSYDGSICTISGRQSVYTVHKETVGQYIGLKDKNGTKIFEGDILRISIKDSDDKIEYKFGAVEFSDKTLGYIIRSKGGLMCSFNTILNSAGFYEFELEVIGNIHDSRNLLK